MENVSEMIWNHLCKIFGTAEEVFVRRQQVQLMDLISDRMNEDDEFNLLLSGSKAEGLNIEGSDMDYMFVFNKLSVVCFNGDNVSHGDIIMDTTNIKPGFARLYCNDMSCLSNTIITPAVTETNNGLVLSSLLFRDNVVKEFRDQAPSTVAHGPCATMYNPISNTDGDCLACFLCKTWPVVAAEWIDRKRGNNWPSRDLITEIVHNGCLVVPIGNPLSQDSFMQWRISFSVAEKKLVHSMNHTQFLCYALLKLYLKHVVNSNPHVKDLLCSYFLKTCLFYCMEEEHITWNKENFLDCFWTCFRRIIKWVRDQYCPNFFIKDNNMFAGKICGDKGRLLLTYLSELYDEGLLSLSRIPCLAWLHCNLMTPEVASSSLTDVRKECICDRQIFYDILQDYPKNVNECLKLLPVIADIKQTSTNNIDRAILTNTYQFTVCHFIQLFYKQLLNNKSNTSRYKYKKEMKTFISHNCIGIKKCTGLLLLATLCYLNGEYKVVVSIVQAFLKKLNSCTFYYGLDTTRICNENGYIERLCGKGLTLNQKLACNVLFQLYECDPDCKMYPPEIEGELVQHSAVNNIAYINPMVYSYVVMFLSYLHVNSRQNMVDTVSELFTIVYDRQLVDKLQAL